jgi:hypothetical protein
MRVSPRQVSRLHPAATLEGKTIILPEIVPPEMHQPLLDLITTGQRIPNSRPDRTRGPTRQPLYPAAARPLP